MLQTTDEIIKAIETDVESITSNMIASLIKDHRAGEAKRRKALWERYTLKDVPIFKHKQADYEKVHNEIANDFYADIVDTKTGYMGNEISIGLDKEFYKTNDVLNESAYDRDVAFLRRFQMSTSSETINSEQVTIAGGTGLGYRLLYVPSGKNEVKTMNLFPWEVIYVFDESLDEPQLAIRYYTMDSKEFGGNAKVKQITIVEWYDETEIRYYKDNGDMVFHLDTSKGVEGRQIHLQKGIPIVPFPNNQLLTAEPEKVTSLIDAYDIILSSTTSEVEQLRLAYMYIKGAGLNIDNEFMKTLEQTGVFPLSENGEIGFINKQLADAPVHNLLAEIRKNIYQFSKSLDMSKDFGGEMRVIGWQVALLNLENSSKITERKFQKALRTQYQMLTDYWREYRQIDIDPYAIEFTFTRNFPRDIKAEAETLLLLLGSISKKTAFSQMSFIDDPEAEIKAMENEASPYREVADVEGLSDQQPESI